MSALDDKDVPSAEQWRDAVTFMTSALSRQIKKAEADMQQLVGPTSYYDRWLLWQSQSASQVCNSNISTCRPEHYCSVYSGLQQYYYIVYRIC